MILGLLIIAAMLSNIVLSAVYYKEGNNEAALPWFILFVVSLCDLITLVAK